MPLNIDAQSLANALADAGAAIEAGEEAIVTHEELDETVVVTLPAPEPS